MWVYVLWFGRQHIPSSERRERGTGPHGDDACPPEPPRPFASEQHGEHDRDLAERCDLPDRSKPEREQHMA